MPEIRRHKALYQPWNEEEFNSDLYVRAMTPVQRWIYRSLLQAAFFCSTRPHLPDSDELLWRLAGCESKQQWLDNKDVVRPMFSAIEEGGESLLAQKHLVRDWERLAEKREALATRGRSGGLAKAKLVPSSSLPREVREVREVNLSPNDDDGSLNQALLRVWNCYLQKTGKNPTLCEFTNQRKTKGAARLRECLRKTGGDLAKAEQLMCLAIDGLVKSDFHTGRDPAAKGKKYLDWETHLFGSYERLEKWWSQ